MRWLGYHEHLISVVKGLYVGCTTSFSVRKASNALIEIRCGVKQGDALTPLLFNIVTDPLLTSLPGVLGLHVDGVSLVGLAYADDMTLVSGTAGGYRAYSIYARSSTAWWDSQ